MAIFSVIDTTSGGDTFYEGMVKAAANWALTETEVTDARGGVASINARLTTDETNISNKADSDHTHGEGGVVYSIVAAEANLGTGSTDGEVKICSVTGNRYMWEAGSAKWQPLDGNQYTTAALPTTAYNIVTGTLVKDTTTGTWKKWSGSAFVDLISDTAYAASWDTVADIAPSKNAVYDKIESLRWSDLTAKTADATLTATELLGNVVLTNTGAAEAVNLTLLAGAADYSFEFEVTVAQYFRFTAAGANKFRYWTTEGAAGGYIRSNVIGTRGRVCWSGGNWSISDLVGVLSYDE
jgi:hypothetical protein